MIIQNLKHTFTLDSFSLYKMMIMRRKLQKESTIDREHLKECNSEKQQKTILHRKACWMNMYLAVTMAHGGKGKMEEKNGKSWT